MEKKTEQISEQELANVAGGQIRIIGGIPTEKTPVVGDADSMKKEELVCDP